MSDNNSHADSSRTCEASVIECGRQITIDAPTKILSNTFLRRSRDKVEHTFETKLLSTGYIIMYYCCKSSICYVFVHTTHHSLCQVLLNIVALISLSLLLGYNKLCSIFLHHSLLNSVKLCSLFLDLCSSNFFCLPTL